MAPRYQENPLCALIGQWSTLALLLPDPLINDATLHELMGFTLRSRDCTLLLSTFFFDGDRVSHWDFSSTLGWVGTEPQMTVCLSPQCWDYKCAYYHCQLSPLWDLRITTQAFIPVQHTLYWPSHLSSTPNEDFIVSFRDQQWGNWESPQQRAWWYNVHSHRREHQVAQFINRKGL